MFPQDIIFEESPDEAIETVNNADIIHLHNYIDLDTRDFSPIDFKALQRSGKAILRQFRTAPGTLAKRTGVPAEKIISPDLPSIVIAQYPERYYPHALVVPNAVPSEDNEYKPKDINPDYDICFSPSNMTYAWSSRWDTKGAPETIQMLKEVKKKAHSKNVIVSGKPLHDVLEKKQKSKIVIDDLVTGSYHASGLEGLCLSKAVVCYLDNRIVKVLKEISRTDEIPFVNSHLAHSKEVLVDLLNHRDTVKSIGELSRKWIDTYWSEKILAERYVGIYKELLENPDRIRRQESLRIDGPTRQYFQITLHDLIYDAQKKEYKKTVTLKRKLKKYFKKIAMSLRRTLRDKTPESLANQYRKLKSS